MLASTITGGGARLRMMGHSRLVIVALLFVLNTLLIGDVLCQGSPAVPAPSPQATIPVPEPSPSPNYTLTLYQFEADALNAILAKWTRRTPQLSTLLKWNPEQHPCDNFTAATNASDGFVFDGPWRGVTCTVAVTTISGHVYYDVSVTSLRLFGRNSSCSRWDPYLCGFRGIVGRLPSEIGNLTNLQSIDIVNNPKLRGPLPVEILGMPSLHFLVLSNNSLSGELPSAPNLDCQLFELDLSNNNFTGRIPVTSQGFFSCSDLGFVDVSYNRLDGPIDLEGLDTQYYTTVSLNNNKFNGSFSISSQFDADGLDLSNNDFTSIKFANYSESTIYAPSLKSLSMINNKLSGQFPTEFLQMPNLESIYFQNNNFTGEFPLQIFKSTSLQTLNGDNNQFDKLILPNIEFGNSNLSEIFLTNNVISRLQYSDQGAFQYNNLQYSSLLFLGGNPMCSKIGSTVLSIICRFNESSQILDVIQKSSTKNKVIIITPTLAACVFIILIMGTYVWRLMGKIKSLGVILREFEKKEVKPNLYSYKEIRLATNNFHKNNKLGEGAFGEVFKGELYDGTTVAVKKLTLSSNQVLSEFLNEVVVISGLKHRNLVKLKGCCLGDGDQRILVFEYVENNNLAEALWMHGDVQNNDETPCLDWNRRFNIILGIARGLAYLHEDLQPPVVHRDIKATNILLDKNFNAKIADFGLAYLFSILEDEASHLTLTQVAGTRGYLSPEYALHGHVSTALDVYSFGIVILEVVSGRKSIDFQKSSEEIYLREWAWKLFEDNEAMTLIDPTMKHLPIDVKDIMQVLKVGLICVHYKVEVRPKMNDVLSMLLGSKAIGNFRRGFEYGERAKGGSSKLNTTSDSTSSLTRESSHSSVVDECSLLDNSCDIEINEMAH